MGGKMEVKILDRTRFLEGVKGFLEINPKTTALVAIDMHQGHLDPEVGIMLVPEEERKRVLTQGQRSRSPGNTRFRPFVILRPIENDRGSILRQTGPPGQQNNRKRGAVGNPRRVAVAAQDYAGGRPGRTIM
jgi:hypothetical protein